MWLAIKVVYIYEYVDVAMRRPERAHEVNVCMAEACFWFAESSQWTFGMSKDIRSLALEAGARHT